MEKSFHQAERYKAFLGGKSEKFCSISRMIPTRQSFFSHLGVAVIILLPVKRESLGEEILIVREGLAAIEDNSDNERSSLT